MIKTRMIKALSALLIIAAFSGLRGSALADEDIEIRDLYYNEYRESLLLTGEGGSGKPDNISGPIPRKYSLGTKEFLRDTAIAYGAQWAGRWFYVRNKNSRIFDTSLSKWWDNISQWPEWDDGDGVMTPAEGDPAIPQSGGSVFGFDMGLGAFYNTENLYVGISTTHLNQTSFIYPEDNAETKLIRHYYLLAGYNFQLSNPMFEIMPSLMLQSDGRSHHIYLNTNLRYNKRFWGGVSYSVGGALTALVGIEMLNGIKIGYSYDFELSPLLKYNSGSHEITVRYCFDLSVDKSPQKYKSIRFL